jgi:hypothetical protein
MMHDLVRFNEKSQSIHQWVDANGNTLHAFGSIKLSWQHYDAQELQTYTKWESEEFYVLPASSSHVQVIFGAPFILKHDLVQFNKHAMVPLTPNKKIDAGKQLSATDSPLHHIV